MTTPDVSRHDPGCEPLHQMPSSSLPPLQKLMICPLKCAPAIPSSPPRRPGQLGPYPLPPGPWLSHLLSSGLPSGASSHTSVDEGRPLHPALICLCSSLTLNTATVPQYPQVKAKIASFAALPSLTIATHCPLLPTRLYCPYPPFTCRPPAQPPTSWVLDSGVLILPQCPHLSSMQLFPKS